MSDHLDAEAIRWFVRLRAQNATSVDRHAHAEWLAADIEHELAYARIEQQWHDTTALEHWARTELSQLNLASRTRMGRRAKIWTTGLATAASLALAGVWWSWSSAPGNAQIVRIVTERAEQRQMALDDGSRLHVNTASDLEVRYTPSVREIVVNSGEGVFDVDHEAQRPFVVRAGRHSVIAVGTRFAVRRKDDGQWSITVIEGRVAVVRGNPSTTEDFAAVLAFGTSDPYGNGVFVDANERLHIDQAGRIVAEEQTDAEEATAWQAGMLKFRQMPLREVAKEISRYTRGEVRVADGVPDYPVTGIIHIRSSETMVDYLVEVVPVTPVKSGAVTVLHGSD